MYFIQCKYYTKSTKPFWDFPISSSDEITYVYFQDLHADPFDLHLLTHMICYTTSHHPINIFSEELCF